MVPRTRRQRLLSNVLLVACAASGFAQTAQTAGSCAVQPDAAGEVILPTGTVAVDEAAFAGCNGMVALSIPNTVTRVNAEAFAECTSLASVAIPNSVTFVGNEAFRGCTALTSVALGSLVAAISDGLFLGCTRLTSIALPHSVTSIGNFAFFGCHALEAVSFGSAVTVIGSAAFKECLSLQSIAIPDSVTDVGESAFFACSALRSAAIGRGIQTVREGTFNSCTGLELLTLPDSVRVIGRTAFAGCTSLASITMGSSVTRIRREAFERCSSLTTLVIPPSVTTIGPAAFGSCGRLTTVTIPPSVQSLDPSAFANCGCAANLYDVGATLCDCQRGSCQPTPLSTARPTGVPTSLPFIASTLRPTAAPSQVPTALLLPVDDSSSAGGVVDDATLVWMIPTIVALCLVGSIAMIAWYMRRRHRGQSPVVRPSASHQAQLKGHSEGGTGSEFSDYGVIKMAVAENDDYHNVGGPSDGSTFAPCDRGTPAYTPTPSYSTRRRESGNYDVVVGNVTKSPAVDGTGPISSTFGDSGNSTHATTAWNDTVPLGATPPAPIAETFGQSPKVLLDEDNYVTTEECRTMVFDDAAVRILPRPLPLLPVGEADIAAQVEPGTTAAVNEYASVPSTPKSPGASTVASFDTAVSASSGSTSTSSVNAFANDAIGPAESVAILPSPGLGRSRDVVTQRRSSEGDTVRRTPDPESPIERSLQLDDQ